MGSCVLGSFEIVKYVFLCVGSTRIAPIFLLIESLFLQGFLLSTLQ